MRFREVPADPAQPRALRQAAREAAAHLRSGGIVVHPTSTLYGLGALASRDGDAVLARLKGRDSGEPFLCLAASVDALRRLRPGITWDERADALARACWPGPLTLVLDDGSPTGLAVRVDSHPVARAVLEALDELMSSTSVNRTGEPPARSPAEVREALERLPDTPADALFLQAGPVRAAAPSTLVSLRERPARVLREGSLPAGEVAAALGEEPAR